jgi:hypothetical protein
MYWPDRDLEGEFVRAIGSSSLIQGSIMSKPFLSGVGYSVVTLSVTQAKTHRSGKVVIVVNQAGAEYNESILPTNTYFEVDLRKWPLGKPIQFLVTQKPANYASIELVGDNPLNHQLTSFIYETDMVSNLALSSFGSFVTDTGGSHPSAELRVPIPTACAYVHGLEPPQSSSAESQFATGVSVSVCSSWYSEISTHPGVRQEQSTNFRNWESMTRLFQAYTDCRKTGDLRHDLLTASKLAGL